MRWSDRDVLSINSVQSTATHLLLSTLSPPAMQAIPWPQDDANAPPLAPEHSGPRTSLLGRLDWLVTGAKSPEVVKSEQAQDGEFNASCFMQFAMLMRALQSSSTPQRIRLR